MLLTSVSAWTSIRRRRWWSLAFLRLVTNPGATHSFSPSSTPNPVSGSEVKTGTTITVGSLAISLYTVEEMTSTVTAVSVTQMSPLTGKSVNLSPARRDYSQTEPH